MSVPSLTASVRTPKVASGLAANIQSERRLNPSYIINPSRATYDTYGRAAPLDSINALTSGFDPLYRIVTENELRPQYSPYLNVPEGLEGVVENSAMRPRMYKSKAGTDTMLGNTPGRYSTYGFSPSYRVDAPLRPAFRGLSKADQDFLKEIERTSRIQNRVYATPRYSAVL